MKRDSISKLFFKNKGIRLFGCLFLLLLAACQNNTLEKIQQVKPLLQSGDIIFRNGVDAVSEAARGFNRKDKRYSHCGIIQIEQDSVFVYHAIGGIYNPSQKLLRQPLELFCNPDETDRFAAYRYKLNKLQQKKLTSVISQFYSEGLPFDIFFNFSTDDKMYCSEFVFKSLNIALEGALQKILHLKDDPVYVSIDDLYLNDAAYKVTEKVF